MIGGRHDAGLISCKRGGSHSQFLDHLLGSDDRTAFGVGGRRFSGACPIGVGMSAYDNSGERKESGERDGEAKQHGGGKRSVGCD